MKLFSTTSDSILVECENCKRVLKISTTRFESFQGKFIFKPPILCKCGLQSFGINVEMEDIFPPNKLEQKEIEPNIQGLPPRRLCPKCSGELERERFNAYDTGVYVIANRCRNSSDCGFIEYICDECGAIMKFSQQEWELFGEYHVEADWVCTNPLCAKEAHYRNL